MQKAKQMTAEMSKTAGAVFHGEVDGTAHPTVNRLQARIVKVTHSLDGATPRPARGV
jgi:hypothetical protein